MSVAEEIVAAIETHGFEILPAGLGSDGKICWWYVGFNQVVRGGITLDVRHPENSTVGMGDTLIHAIREAVHKAEAKEYYRTPHATTVTLESRHE